MASGNSIYRRLTGRKRSLSGYSQLWLGPDHVLMVKSTRFTEQYQRFALADIQAIVVTSLPDRTVAQMAGVAVAVVWMLLLLTVSSTFAKVFFAATGALALAIVLIDIARGPRCRCHLHTAVSRELLGPVSRVRAASRLLETIRPAIEAVQGRLGEAALETQPSAAASVADPPPEVPDAPGYLPEALFALFLLDAALVFIDWRFPRSEAATVLPTTFFAEIVILVVALIRRGKHDPRRFIYALMIAAIFCAGWDAVSLARSLGSWVGTAMETSRRTKGVINPMLSMAGFQYNGVVFAVAWRTVAGLMGLIAAWMERSSGT
jgi:hypothetical protein